MRRVLAIALSVLALMAAEPSWAVLFDDQELSRLDPVYVEECGSCHVAYPAALLPAASWRKLMQGLERHFKVDAVPDPTDTAAIVRYLEAGAGKAERFAGAVPDRISKAPWFVSKHARVRGSGWPKVKTLANCAACHPQAESGRYRELLAKPH